MHKYIYSNVICISNWEIRCLDVRGRLSKLWACLLTGIVGGCDNMESVD